jgi:hypothetical protein
MPVHRLDLSEPRDVVDERSALVSSHRAASNQATVRELASVREKRRSQAGVFDFDAEDPE